jgi:hypothetical protein
MHGDEIIFEYQAVRSSCRPCLEQVDAFRSADRRSTCAHRTHTPNGTGCASPGAPDRHFRVRAGDLNGQSVALTASITRAPWWLTQVAEWLLNLS